jgi:uncharacterized membrane protein
MMAYSAGRCAPEVSPNKLHEDSMVRFWELEGFLLRDQNPRHWKLLVFYCNPENPRLFVPKRTGIPFTINFARPKAWVMTVPVVAGMVLAAIVNNR